MPAAHRLLVVFLVLLGAFVALVGLAVASLLTLGQPVLAAVAGTAGVAGVGAGAVTWWMLRTADDEMGEQDIEIELEAVRRVAKRAEPPRVEREPLRVHSMPVADLPAPYVKAVMRGAQARLSALREQGLPH